jgi:hypothetical protein
MYGHMHSGSYARAQAAANARLCDLTHTFRLYSF